jgi:hypothetical protein
MYSIRDDKDKFEFFVTCYAPLVIGQPHWKLKTSQKPISELLTIDDEAFIVLLLHNSEELWTDLAKAGPGKESTEGVGKKTTTEGTISEKNKPAKKHAKYTRQGDSKNNTKMYGGWSN